MFKVLFIYYNPRTMSLIPPSIAIFSRLLKNIGVEVGLFDTTFYRNRNKKLNPDLVHEYNLGVRPFSDKLKIKYKETDMVEDLKKIINEFNPDLLAVTTTESNFLGNISLLKYIKPHIPTIIGGIFPTFAPEKVIPYSEIDIVCVGEGEKALIELVERMRKKKDFTDVPNLWIKKNGRIIKNPLTSLVSLDENPLPDMELFEEGRFYRAMGGEIYKLFPVESHRGCVYQCGFCNSPTQNRMYRQVKQTFCRVRSIPKLYEEIKYFQRLGAEYFYFWADNFFTYSQDEIDEFCEMYSEIVIPFCCQSHPEDITFEKIRKLKSVGMKRLDVGIEHGNEKFRREVVRRYYSNKTLIEKLKIVEEFNIEYSVNNIIGFPDETPELMMDTVELNRQHNATDIGCSIFAPFHGTTLRELAVKRGYLNKDTLAPSNFDSSVLRMPQFMPEEIFGKRRTFNMYIKFPKHRWNEIEIAEELTPRGDAAWKNLREEYIKTFF